ncbi:MAG TPA: PP2C family protein-serine/threonine phosphatase [Acidobacteriaceae bacterium]|nr:PP2C family protein-serine/threonine phosphatase [Acidobacteriaceae bacterium]
MKRGLEGLARFNPIGRAARLAEAEKARVLQASLLPQSIPQIEGFAIACAWQPSSEVSGDYYDVFPLNGDQMALCVADVSGKGMSAAALTRELREAVRASAPEAGSPAELCTQVNKSLCSRIAPGKYAAMFYGVIDRRTGRLQYENAGHCLPLLVRAGGAVEFPASFSGVLGLFSHWLYNNQEIQLGAGDKLLLVTDGIIEAEGRRGEEFGYQRLISLVNSGGAQGPERLSRDILDAVSKFCNQKMCDDASLIVVAAE